MTADEQQMLNSITNLKEEILRQFDSLDKRITRFENRIDDRLGAQDQRIDEMGLRADRHGDRISSLESWRTGLAIFVGAIITVSISTLFPTGCTLRPIPATPSPTAVATEEPTATPSATSTPTSEPEHTPTPIPSPSPTPTELPSPTATATATSWLEATPTPIVRPGDALGAYEALETVRIRIAPEVADYTDTGEVVPKGSTGLYYEVHQTDGDEWLCIALEGYASYDDAEGILDELHCDEWIAALYQGWRLVAYEEDR